MIKKIAPYAKKHLLFAILGPLTISMEVLLEIQIPKLMAQIVDIGIPGGDLAYILKTGGMMMAYALISLVFGAVSAICSSIAAMGFGSELRKGIFYKLQNYSFGNIDKFSTPSLITRITTDVNNVQMAYMMIIRMLVRSPIMLVSATFMAFTINSSLVTVFLVAIPVLAAGMFIIAVSAFPKFGIMLKKYDGINRTVQENLIAARVVKAFVRSSYEKDKFKEANLGLRKTSIDAEKITILSNPLMQLVMYACIIAILWFGGIKVVIGGMQTGELISFVSYVTQILMSLMMISMAFIMITTSRASIVRINEVLNEESEIKDDECDENLEVESGDIEFKNVFFKYNASGENYTLENINLSIRSGETVGILGGTGSSKTTLVQLIPRLYDVSEGAVLVGGRDVREYNLKKLRDAVSMVLQKNVLFSGTIRENLKWGNENATDEEIFKACRDAQAYDFITSFPDGFDTLLGQGGVNVSGGQKQRLCIARALIKRPKIIILDDSTSAVDTATDSKIRQAFNENLKDTTTIIIAQRITSICDADKIIVLDDGKIVDIGTHDYLVENCEIYRDVYTAQQKGVDEYAQNK
ncbi:MAG: ABC transporter ATP-binding protein [Ruminococcaceae bacterium]|nr:ABC transporter ATP-binding protein [Oscillospiraceae bacterium]